MSEKLRNYLETVHGRRTFRAEGSVKKYVRDILHKFGVFTWMPSANAYGKSGQSDIMAVKYGRIVAIECKHGYNKETQNQIDFGAEIVKAGGAYVVINDRNAVDRLYSVLRYFETNEWVGPSGLQDEDEEEQ